MILLTSRTRTGRRRSLRVASQRGAALIVSLVVLAVLTVLGIASLDRARFESVMEQNAQFQMNALSDAEVVLASAEADIDAITSDGAALAFSPTDDHYYYPPLFEQPDADTRNWSSPYASVEQGRYVVEYWGERSLPGESAQLGKAIAGSRVHLFQVTAQSANGRGARRNVRTVYVTGQAP